MRRSHAGVLILGLVALLIAGLASRIRWSDVAGPSPTALGFATRGLAATESTVARLARHLLPACAAAQEALEFKPVPRESVAQFERMRVVRRRGARGADTLESLPQSPAAPAAPAAPGSPATPRTPVDRSGSLMRIGSDIHVGPDEVIEGDLSSLSGDITIEGHVEGDVVAMRGDIELKSTARVDGDVVCLGGTLTEEPGAHVGGQRVTAPIHGRWRDRWMRHEGAQTAGDGERVASALVWLLVMLLFGWMFARFLEGKTAAAVATLRREPAMALGVGSLVWALIIPSVIALALVVALLCITIIGIPLALAALVGYVLFLAVVSIWGFSIGAAALGGALSKPAHPPTAAPAGAPAPPSSPSPGASLVRRTLLGVTLLIGASVLGRLLHSLSGLGPLRAIGTLLRVLCVLGSLMAMTLGAGALLRSEFVSGTFRRLWNRRQPAGTPEPPAPGEPPPTGPGPAVAPPPVA